MGWMGLQEGGMLSDEQGRAAFLRAWLHAIDQAALAKGRAFASLRNSFDAQCIEPTRERELPQCVRAVHALLCLE